MPTIGLFGTCGNSKWREPFIKKYKRLKIDFFNPQVADWNPECAEEEARHLAEDEIILFPVTRETYGMGSLSEVGFSILQAIRLDDRRDFVIMIEMELDPNLDDEITRKESLRARALVKQHLKKLRFRNVYLVDTLEEMLEVSIQLHKAVTIRKPLESFNPQNRNN